MAAQMVLFHCLCAIGSHSNSLSHPVPVDRYGGGGSSVVAVLVFEGLMFCFFENGDYFVRLFANL
jgi:hypothetical protein